MDQHVYTLDEEASLLMQTFPTKTKSTALARITIAAVCDMYGRKEIVGYSTRKSMISYKDSTI